jgi:hypothetical protein
MCRRGAWSRRLRSGLPWDLLLASQQLSSSQAEAVQSYILRCRRLTPVDCTMADPEKAARALPKTNPAPAVDAIEPAPALPASSPAEEQTAAKVKTRPEREPKPADYFRVFTYATHFDVAYFIVAGLASIGAGIVSGPVFLADPCCC